MKTNDLLVWISANALGLGMGFVAALQTTMLFEFGFDWEMHWNWVEEPVGQNSPEYASTMMALLVEGSVLGAAQAFVIRNRNVPILHWILATVVGFGILAVTIEWPLIAFGVLGVIPGPVEPIILTVGVGIFAGACQYLLLRRQGIFATTWLIRLFVGLIVSLVPMVTLFISLDALDVSLSWPAEVFVNGFIVGGVAALASGRALFTALPGISSNRV